MSVYHVGVCKWSNFALGVELIIFVRYEILNGGRLTYLTRRLRSRLYFAFYAPIVSRIDELE